MRFLEYGEWLEHLESFGNTQESEFAREIRDDLSVLEDYLISHVAMDDLKQGLKHLEVLRDLKGTETEVDVALEVLVNTLDRAQEMKDLIIGLEDEIATLQKIIDDLEKPILEYDL